MVTDEIKRFYLLQRVARGLQAPITELKGVYCICADEMGIGRLAPLPLVPLEAETLCDRFLEHALNRHAYRQSTHGLTQRITTATARMWR